MGNQLISTEAVIAALRTVQEPELHRDLVTLNMVKDIQIEGGDIKFTITLTTPACPLRSQIEAEAKAAVASIPGVSSVKIRFDAKVRGDGKPREIMELPVKNIIAVASGKGGVGKSTIATNLAVSLSKSGASVGLMDADIYGPNIPTMMGVTGLPEQSGQKFTPPEVYGVKIMSIGFLVKPGQPLIWRGPMLHSAIRQFLSDVQWGELDYLVVDLPPGTGDVSLSLAQSITLSGVVIVTLPQEVSLEDASRGVEMFRTLNVPVLGVIENMSFLELPDGSQMDIFGSGGGEKLAQRFGIPFLGSVPLDPKVRVGGDSGAPIVVSHPDSKAAQSIQKAAGQIAAALSIQAMAQAE
jgi:ATP-binding protein involved in chromosome partitioning